MWKQLIQRNGGVVTSALDLSSLAKISDGYTQGQMVRVVRGILTERRIQQLAKRPLVSAEFVAHLARTDPVFQDEEEALKVNKQCGSQIYLWELFPLYSFVLFFCQRN